ALSCFKMIMRQIEQPFISSFRLIYAVSGHHLFSIHIYEYAAAHPFTSYFSLPQFYICTKHKNFGRI
ncbi:MAG: hypothetical protein AAF696_33840, partial [Bacteroidota bacterium]